MASDSPQELITRFWERTLSDRTNTSVTTTLPQSIFAEGFRNQVPRNSGVAENVMADYQRAVSKCKAKVDKIVKDCHALNQKYNDPSFDLHKRRDCLGALSTYSSDEDAVETVVSSVQPKSVKRVRQIFEKPEFFVDGATADDVRQGDVGDCWFLSALSALCCMEAEELGNLVERICVKRDEAVGVYGFVFFRDGEWRSEIVDDKLYLRLPDYNEMGESPDMRYLLKYIKEKDRAEVYRKTVQNNSDALLYAKSAHKDETWVPLIEKAYAKAHGDYAAIDGGTISDGLEDLTGGIPSFFISDDIIDLDQFWDEGLAKVNKSLLWGCHTGAVNEVDKRGLEGNHAYAILEAQTIPNGTRLVKVRNPWRQSEWEGDWSDRSKKWTDELRRLLKHEEADDGIFWITYEDLLRNYPVLYRTRIFDASWTVAQSWTNITVPFLSSDIYENTFRFTLSKAATTVIVLSQLDKNYYKGLEGQYDFKLSFRLHEVDKDDYLHGSHNRDSSMRSVNVEVELGAGVYEVRLKITSERHPGRPKIEDAVRLNWEHSREKLLQICRSYDLAHAKVTAPELQNEDIKAVEPARELSPGKKSEDLKPEAKPDDLASSEVGVSRPESRTGGSTSETNQHVKLDKPVGDGKSDIREARSGSKSEEEVVALTIEDTTVIDTKLKAIERDQSSDDVNSESTFENTHQGYKSETDTGLTAPEIIELGAEINGDDPNTTTNIDAEDLTSGDATAQLLHEQPASAAYTTSTQKKEEDVESEVSLRTNGGHGDDSRDGDKKHAATKENEEHPAEPFNSVCTVGLRVYCKDAEACIEICRPSTTLLRNKQFTSSKEKRLDVDDPAKS